MRDTPRRPTPGDETDSAGLPKASQDKSALPGEARSENKQPVSEPPRGPGRPPADDPNDLQSLLDYRDARARAEARLVRDKRLEDDRRRAGVPEPDDPSPARPTPSGRSTTDGAPRPRDGATAKGNQAHEPMHKSRVGRPVDPEDLQSLLDYRDARARAEAKLGRAKDREYDDRLRAGVPDPDDSTSSQPGRSTADSKPGRGTPEQTGKQGGATRAGDMRPMREPRTPRKTYEIDPEDLQTLLDYRDERARAEARVMRAKRLEHDDGRRAKPTEHDDPSPETPSQPLRSSSRAERAANRPEPVSTDSRADTVDHGDDGPDAKRTAAERARDLHLDISPEVIADLGFDPGQDRGALGDHFRPGLLDPHGEIARKEDIKPKIAEKELKVIQYLVEERGALVTLLPESEGVKNPDSMVRWGPTDAGGTLEFKTLASPNPNTIDHNLRRGSTQLLGKPDPQLLIDGREVQTQETTARQVWAKRVRTSQSIAPTVHFILDRGRWLTLPDDERRES